MINNLFQNPTDACFSENTSSPMLYILNSICSGVIISDPTREGNPITYVNSSFLKITGYKKDEVINSDLFNILFAYADEITNDNLTNLINNNEFIVDKVLNYKKNSTDISLTFNFNPIYDSNNNLLYFVCIFKDITEIIPKKQTENTLKIDSDFLSNISHEIKTPLNSILGTVDLLSSINVDENEKKYLAVLKKNTKLLLDLTENMINLLELQTGNEGLNNSLFNIHELLNELVDHYQNKILTKGLAFNYNLDMKIPQNVIGDSLKLKNVISALIDNSLRFTEVGEISLIVQLKNITETNKIFIGLTISDTGIGMPKDQLSNILETCPVLDSLTLNKYNTKPLGLALTKKLIDLLSGSIHIKSDLNVGTIVECEFGLMSTPISDTSGDAKKILLVDDSEDNRFLIHSYLKKTNYILDDAENGEIAYEKFKTNTYDLILMDIQMPVMDGYTATTLIRSYEKQNNLPETTIAALTAYSFKEDLEKTLEVGCNFTLMKPIKKSILLETLNDIL